MTNRDDTLQVFIEACREVLQSMAGADFSVKETEPARSVELRGEVASSIGLSGAGEGMLVVVASEALVRQLVGAMLETSPREIAYDDALDGFGEIVNMIAGTAKRAFADTPNAFRIGLPTVIGGATGTIRPGLTRVGAGTLVRGTAADAGFRFAVWLAQ